MLFVHFISTEMSLYIEFKLIQRLSDGVLIVSLLILFNSILSIALTLMSIVWVPYILTKKEIDLPVEGGLVHLLRRPNEVGMSYLLGKCIRVT
jgi:hypothetical protein